jgi:hypothetical protein
MAATSDLAGKHYAIDEEDIASHCCKNKTHIPFGSQYKRALTYIGSMQSRSGWDRDG